MRKSRLAIVVVAACLVVAAVTATCGARPVKAGAAKAPAVPELQLKWTHRFTVPYRLYLSGGTLYAASGEVFSAFDVATGRRRWRALLDGSAQSDPLQMGDTIALLVGDDDYNTVSLTGFSAGSGKQLWTVAAKGGYWVDGPALTSKGSMIYFEDRDGNLYAVDSKAGKLKWSKPGTRGKNRGGPPIVAGDSVIWSDGDLSALDAKTGAVRWTHKCAPRYTGLFGATSRTAFFTTTGGAEDLSDMHDPTTLSAIDLKTGAARWDLPVRNAYEFTSSICATTDGIMLMLQGKRLVATDINTGREIWTDESDLWPARYSVHTDGTTVCFTTAPLLQPSPDSLAREPEVVIGDNGATVAVRALDLKTGKLLWQRPGIGLTYAATVDGGLACIVDFGSNLLIVDARSGEQKWQWGYVERTGEAGLLGDGSIFFGKDMLLFVVDDEVQAVSVPGLRPSPPGDQTGQS